MNILYLFGANGGDGLDNVFRSHMFFFFGKI